MINVVQAYFSIYVLIVCYLCCFYLFIFMLCLPLQIEGCFIHYLSLICMLNHTILLEFKTWFWINIDPRIAIFVNHKNYQEYICVLKLLTCFSCSSEMWNRLSADFHTCLFHPHFFTISTVPSSGLFNARIQVVNSSLELTSLYVWTGVKEHKAI